MVSLQKAGLDQRLLQGLLRAILFTARSRTKLLPPLQKVVLISMVDTYMCARTHACTRVTQIQTCCHVRTVILQPSLENWSHQQISVLSDGSSPIQACGALGWEGLPQGHSHPSLTCSTQQALCFSLPSSPQAASPWWHE